MDDFFADLRYTLRGLGQAPVFAVVAVLSMAFGIGANTAVFTLVDQVLLRRLAVERPEELVQVTARGTEGYGGGMGDGTELSYAMYRDLRERNDAFSAMACDFSTNLQVGYAGRSERADGELVSGSYFPALGVGAAIGRVFNEDDDLRPGGHPLAVLGYRYWQARFGGDPSVVGRTLRVNGHPLEVVGVVEPAFAGIDLGQPAQVYVPIAMQPQMGPAWLKIEGRRFRWVRVYARLKTGVTAERAAVSLQPLYASILRTEAEDAAFASAAADTKARFLQGRLSVDSAAHGHSNLRDAVTRPLLILMAVAGGVLLIVCANVANLLVARGLARRRELALRLALGATRSRLFRLLLVESLVVAAVGTAIGTLLAEWGAGVLLGYFSSAENPLAVTAAADTRIVAFSGLLGALAALAAGSLSAARVAGADLAPTLAASSGTLASAPPRLQKTLVVTQVALSFLLLIGAGLFLRTLRNLMDVEPGFRTVRMLTFSVDLEKSGYDGERGKAFFDQVLSRVSRLPGVSGAGSALFGLLGGGGWGMGFTVEGFEPKPGEDAGSMCNGVSPGFFAAMGIPVLAGREFDERDAIATLPAEGWPYRSAVVNETFARRYFAGRSPVGRHVGIGEDPGTPMPIEIVGIVKDAKYTAIREEPRPQIFFTYLQAKGLENVTTYVRVEGPTAPVLARVRKEIAALDPGLALYDVGTVSEKVERSITNERLIASLSGSLSVVATLLSIVGLYGVMAYSVTRRTREIGIRLALGAFRSRVARGVVGEAAVLIVLGLVIGYATSFWLGRYLESQLYGVGASDLGTSAIAALLLGAVAVAAASIPAIRAARIEPMSALRQE
jgi:putative ABC transport system permease protein